MIEELRAREFDVLVVGGGITGCGIALDAVTRGLRTALVERSAYREMFLNGQPPTVTEPGKGAGLEIQSLLAEIRAIIDETTNTVLRKAG